MHQREHPVGVLLERHPEDVCKHMPAGADETKPYRCSTRSRISSVRPWFQNCVPM